MDNEIRITTDILKANGFYDITREDEMKFWEQNYIEDFSEWEYADNRNFFTMKHNLTNSDNEWGLHIDNSDRDSVGSFDITYVWQFNKLMEVLGTEYRLKA